MKEVCGEAMSIQHLLVDNVKTCDISYFQRDYCWENENVQQLVNDLLAEFGRAENKNLPLDEMSKYFVGTITINHIDYKKYIIDGQQRLTTLTLLFICLRRMLNSKSSVAREIDQLLFLDRNKSKFRLDIKERDVCMGMLYKHGKYPSPKKSSESVNNLIDRYEDISGINWSSVADEEKAKFAKWLMHNVQVIRVITRDKEDAYTIFETMNDRGLSLTSTDLLRGYLLSNIEDDKKRKEAHDTLKEYLDKFRAYSKDKAIRSKDVAHDFFVAWLRAQHAEKMRKHSKDAVPLDYKLIGKRFDRWVRNNKARMGLDDEDSFHRLITKEIRYFADRYLKLLDASKKIEDKALRFVKYNADIYTSLQYYFILASLKEGESEAQTRAKMSLVADFIDSWLSIRSWNGWIINYSLVEVRFFKFAKKIRGMESIAEMRDYLLKQFKYVYADDDPDKILLPYIASLHSNNAWSIRRILARISNHFDGKYEAYVDQKSDDPYTIEHIFPAEYKKDKYGDEFSGPEEYEAQRERIGALVLLPHSVNAQLSDKHYCKKRNIYARHDILAASLHEAVYTRGHPLASMLSKAKTDGFNFQFYKTFGKQQIQARSELYAKIADAMWSPDAFKARTDGYMTGL